MKLQLLRGGTVDELRSLKPDTTTEKLRLKQGNLPPVEDLVEPPVLESSAVRDGNQVEIGLIAKNVPEPPLTVTVAGSPFTPIFTFPGRYIVDLEPAAVDRTVAWTATATNSAGSATTSGSIVVPASLSVPAAFEVGDWLLSEFIDVPDAFGVNDWTLVDVPAGPVATVPDAFVVGDWTLENVTGGEQPPPVGNLTAPTNVTMVAEDDRTIVFTWGPPTTGTPTAYDALYSTDGLTFTTVSNVTSPYRLTVPLGGWTYTGRVAARNASGSVNSTNRTARTQTRPYATTADWNLKISDILSRGYHPNESYIQDVLWFGNEGPGNGPQLGQGVNWCNFFSRDYTYPVYRSSDATLNATVSAGDGNFRSGSIPWNPSWVIPSGTDAQIIVVNEVTGEEWNGFQCAYNSGTNTLTATRVNRVTVNADGTGGAANYRTKSSGFRQSRGCGIQYLAMLITLDEIEQGKIYHALSMVMRRSGHAFYSVPATKGERYPGNELQQGIPQGTRFFLDITDAEIDAHIATWPSDVSSAFRRTMKIVFTAMKEYGWIATDQGGDNHIQFQHQASAVWEPHGIETNFTASNGKVYPRDAIDGIISNKARIRVLRPADNILHYYEAGSDNPRRGPVALVGGPFPFRTPTGAIEQRVVTDVGRPRIELSGSTTLVLTRRAQFFGQHPITIGTPQWFRNGTPVGTGTFYNTGGTPGTYICRESASNANGTTPIDSNSITI